MFMRSAGLLLALAFAIGAHADSPPLPDCSAITVRVDWTPESATQPLEGCISPGHSTVYRFDAPLLEGPEGVEVGPEGGALEVARGPHGFALFAPEDMPTGGAVLVRVQLAGKVSPSHVMVRLVVHPARVTRQVKVFLHPRPVEEVEQEARECRLEASQCHQEKAQVLAACTLPVGLRVLVANGAVPPDQFAALNLTRGLKKGRSHSLLATTLWVYRAGSQVVFALQLINHGPEALALSRVALRGPGGAEVTTLPLGEAVALGPGETRWMTVEAVVPAEAVRGFYSLVLWEEGGKRAVVLEQLSLP